MKDPNAVAEKWARNLGASTEDIRRGVQAVTVSPGQKAAAAAELWVRNTAASRDKFARNTSRVSLNEWQTATIEKGLPRVASGAQAAQPKMQSFMAEFLPYAERVKAQIATMPKGGIENSIARSAQAIRAFSQFKRSGGSA